MLSEQLRHSSQTSIFSEIGQKSIQLIPLLQDQRLFRLWRWNYGFHMCLRTGLREGDCKAEIPFVRNANVNDKLK